MAPIRREPTMTVARDEQGRRIASACPGGVPKVAAQVRELAQRACPAAVDELVRLMHHSDDDRVRVAAARELLDRGTGRAERASGEASSASLTEALGVSPPATRRVRAPR